MITYRGVKEGIAQKAYTLFSTFKHQYNTRAKQDAKLLADLRNGYDHLSKLILQPNFKASDDLFLNEGEEEDDFEVDPFGNEFF